MKDKLDYIKLEALGLSEGQTVQVDCPQCGKPKLSITRTDNGILYNCWRASCTLSGAIGGVSNITHTKPPFQPRIFTGNLKEISNELYSSYISKYHMGYPFMKKQAKEIVGEHGIAIPLYNQDRIFIGYTTKHFDSAQKAMHYIEVDSKPAMHFPLPAEHYNALGRAVLVEDALSAMKINYSSEYQGVALLGTHFSDDHAKLLLKSGYNKLAIWLDPDARDKAASIKQKYGIFFNEFRVVYSDIDPKDTPIQETVAILKELFRDDLV